MDLAVSSTAQGERTIVNVGGEIDVYTAPALRRQLDDQIHKGCRDLVVDLGDVTFLDSTGLGVLVGRLKLIRAQGGTMRIVGTQERVLKVFTITGLDRVFEILPSQADLADLPDDAPPPGDATSADDHASPAVDSPTGTPGRPEPGPSAIEDPRDDASRPG